MFKTLAKLAALCCLALAAQSCELEQPTTPHEQADTKLAAKHEPLQEYLDLRLGLNHAFDLDAYQQAVRGAVAESVAAEARGVLRPAGFDKPWRVEGPTNLGGRVNVLAVDARDPDVAYLGYSRGGLWGTTDGGATWSPLTEELPFPTIGAVALDTAAERLWIGTGDPNISGYWHIGDGAYYSDDGGASWTRAGLEDSGVISKLIVDPRNSDIVYAAVMGRPYTAGPVRGVYRTTDRGQTWTQIKFFADDTGASDLWMSPANPDVLYATAWPRVRNQFASTVRGEGAQLYRSTDAGQTWESLYDRMGYDLPASRLGFAIAPGDADVLYLSVCGNDLTFDTFWRSDDGGDTWTEVSNADSPGWEYDGQQARPFASFGWFFGQTRVDPLDEDHVWILGVRLWESFDGGVSWDQDEDTDFSFFVHADKHAMEILPAGGIWLGTDGGAYRKPYGGTEWEDIEDIPTNMFYRVADVPRDTVDYAGGMQDNGTAVGSVAVDDGAWFKLFGADGFQPTFAPEQPDAAIVETQRGRLWYVDGSGLSNELTPPHADEQKSWDMPVASYYDADLDLTYLLTASNYPYEGDFGFSTSWLRYPQLLTSDSSNSRLVATAAHIAADQTYYIGTSEGWLWRLAPNTTAWERLTTGFTERYITDVTTAPDDPSVVYVTMSEYYNGDRSPYVLRSADGGDTWEPAQGDLPDLAVNALLSIPRTSDSVLVAATDVGVYASVDGGRRYERLGTGMTNVPVFDLAYDTLSHRLIAGTFGRSIQTYPLAEVVSPDTVDVSVGEPRARTAGLRVYPNPASTHFNFEATLRELDRGSTLQLFDARGREVLRRAYVAGTARLSERVGLPAAIPTGMYTVVVRNRHDAYTAELTVR